MGKIKKDIDNRKSIEINGYNNLLPLNLNDFSETKTKKGIKILSFVLLFIVSIISFGFLALFVQKNFKIDINNQTSILSLAVIAASLITSFFFGNKSNLPAKIVEKLIEKL